MQAFITMGGKKENQNSSQVPGSATSFYTESDNAGDLDD